MHVYESDLTTGYQLTVVGTLTGTLAAKVYKTTPESSKEQILARAVGLKNYELKDHLGNVRSVVTDLLSATGTGATPINDTRILAYYNYYPFG